MSDELWDREGHRDDAPASGDDLTTRVDELFSSAVERQVTEQRNLNRLLTEVDQSMAGLRSRIDELAKQVARDVAPTADRIAGLDTTVRSLRESQSQQHVTLRAELEEAVTTFRQEASARTDELASQLDDLRRADAAAVDRLADVHRDVGTALERLDARQEGFASELARLGTRLTDAAEAAEAARDAITPLATRVETAVGELGTGLERSLAARSETLDQRLEAFEARVGDRVGEITDRLESRIEARLADLLGTVEDRLAQLGERLERQEYTLGELPDVLTEGVRRGVAEVTGELTAERDARSAELAQLQEDLLGSLRDTLLTGTTDLRETLDDRTEVLTARLTVGLEELRERAALQETSLAERVTGLLSGVGEGLDDRVATLARTLEERMGQLDGQVAAVQDEVRTQRGTLGAHGDAIETGLASARTLLRDELADVRRTLEAHLERAGATLDDQLSAGFARQQDVVGGVAENLRALAASLRADLNEVQELGPALARNRELVEVSLLGQSERMDRTLAELQRSLEGRLGALGDGLGDVVARVGAVEGGLQAQAGGIREVVTEVGGVRERIAAAVDAVRARLVEEQERGLARLGDDQASRLDQLAGAQSARLERFAAELDELRRHLTEQQQASLAEVGETVAAAQRRIDTSRAGLEDAVAAMADRGEALEAAVATALDRLAERIREEAASTNTELEVAVGKVVGVSTHLDRMERSLLRYLEARDERLGRERTVLLRELVEQLAEGLSKRERRRLAAKLELPAAPSAVPDEPAASATPGTGARPHAGSEEVVRVPDEAVPVAAGPRRGSPAPRRATAPRAPARGARASAPAPVASASPREVLAGVRGLGPAKQSALIDAFGTVEALRQASVEDLADVPGIGPALAESIAARLR